MRKQSAASDSAGGIATNELTVVWKRKPRDQLASRVKSTATGLCYEYSQTSFENALTSILSRFLQRAKQKTRERQK